MTYATILVNLEAGRSNAHLLQAACVVADRFEAGVIGSTACAPLEIYYGDGYPFADILDQDREEIDRETARCEAEFRDTMGNRSRGLSWCSAIVGTSLASNLARQSRRADLVLTSAAAAAPRNVARQVSTDDLIMEIGRPLLLVAPAPAPLRLDRVMIAWKDTREARRATADALPLLKRASHVSIVEIAPDDELGAARLRLEEVAEWLGRHGVAAHVHASPTTGDDAAGLRDMADEQRADIVVAGAYGHSRLQEWVLGGVTRTLLRHGTRSSLVSH